MGNESEKSDFITILTSKDILRLSGWDKDENLRIYPDAFSKDYQPILLLMLEPIAHLQTMPRHC